MPPTFNSDAFSSAMVGFAGEACERLGMGRFNPEPRKCKFWSYSSFAGQFWLQEDGAAILDRS